MKSSGLPGEGRGSGWPRRLLQQLLWADSRWGDSPPSFCPCACCRNKGMRTRLGCLSHKSDSCSDFTAILPDKPNRALKWVVRPPARPGCPQLGAHGWAIEPVLLQWVVDQMSQVTINSCLLEAPFFIPECEWENVYFPLQNVWFNSEKRLSFYSFSHTVYHSYNTVVKDIFGSI